MKRNTAPRKAILDVLAPHKDHPTADEIYREVREILPNVSLGTVYRNLDKMSQAGFILKIEGAGQKRFDPNPAPHPHFRCDICGCVEDIPEIETLSPIDNNLSWYQERDITGVKIELYGLCPKCKQNRTLCE